jgi:hypothetical protein
MVSQERSPGDDFDQLVLDEDFVAGATISEESAEARKSPRPSQERRARRSGQSGSGKAWHSLAGGRKIRRSRRSDRRRSHQDPEETTWSRSSGWLKKPPSLPPLRSWSIAQWLTSGLAAAVVGVVVWLGVGGLGSSGSSAPAQRPPATSVTTTPAVIAPPTHPRGAGPG